MRVRIESEWARRCNDVLEEGEKPRNEIWQGVLPDMNLGGIFRFFNRVEEGDDERLDEIGYSLPSLSVGDYVTKDGKRYRVEPVGFVEAA